LGASPQTPGVYRIGPRGHGLGSRVSWRGQRHTTRHQPLWRAPAAPVALRQSRILRTTRHAPSPSNPRHRFLLNLSAAAGQKTPLRRIPSLPTTPPSTKKPPSGVVHFEVITGGAF
jgi:hypothetical protein